MGRQELDFLPDFLTSLKLPAVIHTLFGRFAAYLTGYVMKLDAQHCHQPRNPFPSFPRPSLPRCRYIRINTF